MTAIVSGIYKAGKIELLADLVAGALVIGVRMGEGVRIDDAASQLTQDALRGVPGAGVDEDVSREVHVDRMWRKAIQQEQLVGELLQRGQRLPSQNWAVAIRRAMVSVQDAPSNCSRTAAALP